jgi:N-acetylglucosamine-6-phosphate deacetylase
MTTTLLRGATAIDERGETDDAWVLIDGDRIAATGSGAAPDAGVVVDLGDAILVPGFVDLHGHGAGGHAYDDGGAELTAALNVHRAHGTTRSVISMVTNPLAELRERLAEVAALTATDPLVLGSHLEGPFLAPGRRGAHNPEFLRSPDHAFLYDVMDS